MLVRILFGAALVISLLLAYQKFSQQATVSTISEAHPDFIMGKQNAPHTVIMFFDYNSKWARRAHPVLLQLISQNPDIRVILRDYPGVTDFSDEISRIVLATREKDRYMEMHNAVMSVHQQIDEKLLRDIVAALGMDYEELERLGQSEEISRLLEENRQAAFFLGIDESGPSFVVDGQIMMGGGFSVDDFKATIRNANR